MTQYQRITGKVFGGNATATGDDPQIAQFGSALANTFIGTTDPAIIQQLPAWGQGFIGAVTPETQFPALPEMTGAMKVLSHQICGILQQGVSTWDSGTIYYAGNFSAKNGRLYISQIDENQGNDPETDTTNWQEFSSGGGLEIGDIGIAPLGIDETKGKRRYLNGQIIVQDQYTVFSEKVKNAITQYPTLGCTEQEWQTIATMTVGGQVGKFVVDNEGGTIRLPKIIMPIQGLTDLSKLAEIVEAGSPEIDGYLGQTSNTAVGGYGAENTYVVSGAFSKENFVYYNSAALGGGTGSNAYNLRFKASLSNPIYGNSDTVQQEQIQYPYFIQVATGSETEDNIINTLELNNPFVLLEPKFFEKEVYNVSWLLANETYNGSNAVHPSAYQALLVENNTEITIGSTVTLPIGTEYTKRGLSVKLSTDSNITDYDFVVNTSDETFRLPIKVNLASGKSVVGNGMSLGITDGTTNAGMIGYAGNLANRTDIYGKNVGTGSTQGGAVATVGAGIVKDPTKSGLELSDSNLYLYFYVGEVAQNTNLVNAGRIEEKITSLIPDNSSVIASYGMPSNKYIDLTLGASQTDYIAPADGYYQIAKNSTASGQYVLIAHQSDDGTGINGVRLWSSANGQSLATMLPCKKGDKIVVVYTAGGNTDWFRFIYAEGEV